MFVLRTRHAHINGRCPGSLQLSLRLLNFYFRSNPSLETVLIQFQGLLVLLDCRVEELFLGIQAASLKIVDGQIGVHAQIDRGQVCRTRLRLFPVRLDIASNSAPDVSLVRNIERQRKVVVGDAVKSGTRWRTVCRCPRPSSREPRGHSRIIVSAIVA